MTKPPASLPSATLPPAGYGPPPMQVSVSTPEVVQAHVIMDHELRSLSDAARPVSLGLACTFAGGVLGLVPSWIELVKRLPDLGIGDLVIALLTGGLVFGAVTCWIYAKKGIARVDEILAEVRARPSYLQAPAKSAGSRKAGHGQ